MLIDTHAHINDPVYRGGADVVAQMQEDGLEKLICIGSNEFTSASAVRLADEYERVYAAVGVHPSDTGDVGQGYLGVLESLAKNPKCVAIGEIGLDYHYEGTDKETQKAKLIEQLDLVRKVRLPAVFHVRDAFGDFNEILEKYGDRLTAGAVMHCYSGSRESAVEYVRRGFYISFSGSITFKSNKKAAEVIDAVPLDRILVETDCPYLTPEPFRGTLNYPKYVRYQAEKVAAVKGLSFEEVERITTENAYRLFTRLR